MFAYHYTTANGIIGIVDKDELKFWFTNYRYLNDKSEGMDIKRILNEVCDELYKNNVLNENRFKLLKELTFESIDTYLYPDPKEVNLEVLKDSMIESDTFICSFSN